MHEVSKFPHFRLVLTTSSGMELRFPSSPNLELQAILLHDAVRRGTQVA